MMTDLRKADNNEQVGISSFKYMQGNLCEWEQVSAQTVITPPEQCSHFANHSHMSVWVKAPAWACP